MWLARPVLGIPTTDADLDAYVTRKMLDGLFKTMASHN
jgi:hypothetical protein